MTLNDNQQRAVDFYMGNANIIATAGSGKTSVLVNRIVNLIRTHEVKPENILAITFSKKAKESMENRLSKLLPFEYKRVNINTFHSLGFSLMRQFNAQHFTLLESKIEKAKILKEIDPYAEEQANEIISYIGLNKNRLQLPEESPSTYNEQIYSKYEAEKERRGLIDYDDMLIKTYMLLKDNKDALKYCTDKFKFILVDEAQDLNKANSSFLRLIGKANNNVFIVNDPLQSIYHFRGSDNIYVLNFHKDWKNVTVINLNTNYRSTKDIVDFSNRYAKTIKDAQHEFYVESTADKAAYKSPTLTVYSNEFDEAYDIASKIKERVGGKEYTYKDFAVLARTNAQLQIYETVFYNQGLPCGIVDGFSFIDKKEIKIILAYLKLAHDTSDNDSFRYIYWQPLRGLGKAFLSECENIGRKYHLSLYDSMNEMSGVKFSKGKAELNCVIETLRTRKWNNVKEQIDYIRKRLDVDEFISKDICSNNEDNDENEKTENLNSLGQIAEQFKTLPEFIDYMSKFSSNKKTSDNQIKLSTIHKSKGLEFPVVFVIGINDGVLPHQRNKNIEEEKRLCYVAITRAEKELYCSTLDRYSLFITDLFGKPIESEDI